MPQINDGAVQKVLAEIIGLQVVEGVPNQVANAINAVLEVNPLRRRFMDRVLVRETAATSAGGDVHVCVDAPIRTFLRSISMSYVKDATCDRATGSTSIGIIQKGQTTSKNIIGFALLTLTAQQFHETLIFDPPIELKPLSSIRGNSDTFTVGTRYLYQRAEIIEL